MIVFNCSHAFAAHIEPKKAGPAPLIGELPYLPRAEQRELSRYVDLDMLGNVMAIDRIPA